MLLPKTLHFNLPKLLHSQLAHVHSVMAELTLYNTFITVI